MSESGLALGLVLDNYQFLIGGPFSWGRYTGIETRYDATVLVNMRTSAAAHFDGTNWLGIDTAAATAYPVTMCCWFRTTRNATQRLMVVGDGGTSNQILLYHTGTGILGYVREGGASGSPSNTTYDPDDGAWHFAALVTEQASRYAYFDDSVSSEETTDVEITSTYDRTDVGRDVGVAANLFIGDIDNDLVWTRALTPANMAWLNTNKPTHNTLLTSTDADNPGVTGLVMANPLDEMSGVRMDYSGNNMHLVPGGDAKGVTFASADSEWANVASTGITAPPCSMFCSFKSTDASPGATNGLMCVGEDADNRLSLRLSATDKLDAVGRAGLGDQTVVSSAADAADQAWHFGGAVFEESGGDIDNTIVYLDGVAANDGTNRTPPSVYLETSLASHHPHAAVVTLKGTLDNASFWSVVITAPQEAWLRTGGLTGGPATYQDVLQSNHADNPGTTGLVSWKQLNESDPSGGNTLVDVHDPTYNMTTASGGAGSVSATGHVIDLPYAVAGTVSEVAEVEDRATEFNDTTDSHLINSSSGPSVSYPFTVECWIRTSSAGNRYPFGFGIDANNECKFQINNGSCRMRWNTENVGLAQDIFGSGANDGEWHHLIGIVRSNNVEGALDGTLTGSPTAHTLNMITPTKIAVGGLYNDPTVVFDGVIDECRVWNSELSSADITALYNDGAGVLSQDLKDETVVLPSEKKPIHAWPCSSNHPLGMGEDIGTVGGITLTETNSPTDAAGIPAGQTLHGLCWQLTDLSGNDNHALQTTFASRPEVVRVDDGAGYALQFDGVDDVLKTSQFGALSQPNVIVSVHENLVVSGSRYFIDSRSGLVRHIFYVTGGDRNIHSGSTITGSAATTSLEQWTGIFNGASSVLYVDGGAADASGDAGSEDTDEVVLGDSYQGIAPANLRLRQMFLNDGALTTAELNTIGQKLATDHGLTWTAIA